jgi:hypothetical protein
MTDEAIRKIRDTRVDRARARETSQCAPAWAEPVLPGKVRMAVALSSTWVGLAMESPVSADRGDAVAHHAWSPRPRRGQPSSSAGNSIIEAKIPPRACDKTAGDVSRAKPKATMPAAFAASTPSGLSSTIAHREGATPRLRAA